MNEEDNLTWTKLHDRARLLEEGIDHHVVEVTHPLIEMSVEMLTILEIMCIQVLAREASLEMLEIIKTQMTALTNLLPPSHKWLRCSPTLMGCPSHLRCSNY